MARRRLMRKCAMRGRVTAKRRLDSLSMRGSGLYKRRRRRRWLIDEPVVRGYHGDSFECMINFTTNQNGSVDRDSVGNADADFATNHRKLLFVCKRQVNGFEIKTVVMDRDDPISRGGRSSGSGCGGNDRLLPQQKPSCHANNDTNANNLNGRDTNNFDASSTLITFPITRSRQSASDDPPSSSQSSPSPALTIPLLPSSSASSLRSDTSFVNTSSSSSRNQLQLRKLSKWLKYSMTKLSRLGLSAASLRSLKFLCTAMYVVASSVGFYNTSVNFIHSFI